MASRSFFVVTLFATLVGMGLAELVQSEPRRTFGEPNTAQLGMCLASGIGCSSAPRTRF